MKDYIWAVASAFLLVASMVLLSPSRAAGQTAVAEVEKAADALAPKGWKPPHTADGQPDLQGLYTNVSLTPLARPKDLGDKVLFTPAEQEAYIKNAIEARNRDRARTGGAATFGVGREYDNSFLDSTVKATVTLQTSLIVDPPDGRMPAFTPEVQQEVAARAAKISQLCADPARVCPPGYDGATPSLADKPTDFSLMSRCIQWATSGPPMLPSIYDSNYHIVQVPGYVMIFTETIHDARIIPLDGRPHLPDNIRQLSGDSRGHWEGNTLVVDTTNFSNMTDFRNAGRNLHITERFRRVAPDVLLYEFTVDDPTTFTKPWTAIVPMTTIKGPIFEYACSEGNYALADIMRGARLEEKKRAGQGAQEGQSKAAPENGGPGQQ